MPKKENDGFVAVVGNPIAQTVKLSTIVDSSSVTVQSLTRCYLLAPEFGFGSKASDISIVPDGDSKKVIVSADFPIHRTGQSKHEIRRDFVGLLRKAGIVERPMVCRIVVPVMANVFK